MGRKHKQQYTHYAQPLPFDNVHDYVASLTPTKQKNSQKSFGGVGDFGFDLNTAARNSDLPASAWGVAIALTASVAAYSCNNKRSLLVGSMPYFLRIRGSEDKISESTDNRPKHPFMAAVRRAEKVHGDTFFGLWEYGYGVHGEAYIEKISNKFNFPADIMWLDPLYMSVFAPRGIITEYMYSGIEGTLRLPAHCVAFDRYRHPYDHLRGLSPLEVALQGINISRALKQEILNFYKRAMRPGVLVSPGKDTQFDNEDTPFLREFLFNNAVGSANAYKPLMTPKHVEITKFDPPSLVDQSDLEERIEKSIHKAFGVSPAMTGDPDATAYKSSADEDEWLFNHTIRPECERIARVINRDLLPFFDDNEDVEFAFDYSDYSFITEADEKQARVAQIFFESGLATRNEARKEIGLPELPDGDVFITDIQPTAAPALPDMAQPEQTQPTVTPSLPDPQPDMITLAPSEVSRRAVQGDALSELEAWRKVTTKSYTRPFETVHIDDDVAYLLRREIEATNGDGEAVKSVFANWRRVLKARTGEVELPAEMPEYVQVAGDALKRFDIASEVIEDVKRQLYIGVIAAKALTQTRARFESELQRQMMNAFNSKVKKPTFIRNFLTMLTRYSRLAYVDGYADVGMDIDLDDPNDDESAAATAWLSDFIDEQERYVRNIADVLYADDQISEDEIKANKPTLWWTGSVYPAYAHALTTAGKNIRLKWKRNPAKESCRSCITLDGIVLTATRWDKEGVYPGSRELACWGGNCGCEFEVTKAKKYRGKLPQWRFAKSAHVHSEECDHEHR